VFPNSETPDRDVTVKVRSLTFDDAAAILAGTFDAELFWLNRQGKLAPATMGEPEYIKDIFDAEDNLLGSRFQCETQSPYGHTFSPRFVTSREAREPATRQSGRKLIARPWDRPERPDSDGDTYSHDLASLFTPDDEDGVEMAVQNAHGTQASLSLLVADEIPEVTLERARKALLAEFGDAMLEVKFQSRFATDERIHVFDNDGALIAANVLSAEIMRYRLPVTTTPVAPGYQR
jgi:hypothetical protein